MPMPLLICDCCDCLVVGTCSSELPQCGHCPHAGRKPRGRAYLWKNNFEQFYTNEGWGASWQERPLSPTLVEERDPDE